MGWDGSGNFSRDNGTNSGTETWQDDAAASIKIRADNHDTHDQDLADGIEACLTKNNETKPTANFAPNADNSYDLGTSSLQWKDIYYKGDLKVEGSATETVTVLGTSGTVDIDFSAGTYFRSSLTGNITFTFSGAIASKNRAILLELENGGDYTITWPSSIDWGDSGEPTWTSTFDIITIMTRDNGTTHRAFLGGLGFSS